MENQPNNERPIILEIEDFKQNLLAIVNRTVGVKGVPYYFIESILSEVYKEVRNKAQQELAMVRKQVEAKTENQKQEE